MTGLYHGTWWGQQKDEWDPLEEDRFGTVAAGRFIRLFSDLERTEFKRPDLRLLAGAMTAEPELRPTPEGEHDPEEDSEITAAYTYLGQFTDHDLTFDPTSRLREALTGEQLNVLADFRTPRFDLDNLYGRGPDDQPYLYADDGIHMLLGEPLSGNPFDPDARDLPRGPNGRALIGDPRNDENRIVAQLHATFLRFHNQVADYLAKPEHLGKDATFEVVRQQVQWHYQWMLVTDFLPAVVNEGTYRSVFGNLYRPSPGLPWSQHGRRLMPVEFSVAAFRFGHSMIRPQYRLNTTVSRRPVFLPAGQEGAHADAAADLRGFRPIPNDWAIDWQFFIKHEDGAEPRAISPLYDPVDRRPQPAYKIDTSLVSPLGDLPPQIASHPPALALRNLERGNIFRLPSGQEVAKALGEKVIPDGDLLIRKVTAQGVQTTPLCEIAGSFEGRAPLWAYILSEAQATSRRNAGPEVLRDNVSLQLGPVGGRLVAGVFAALLRGDPTSYLNTDHLRLGTPFKPITDFTRDGQTFGLAELINVALGRMPVPAAAASPSRAG